MKAKATRVVSLRSGGAQTWIAADSTTNRGRDKKRYSSTKVSPGSPELKSVQSGAVEARKRPASSQAAPSATIRIAAILPQRAAIFVPPLWKTGRNALARQAFY